MLKRKIRIISLTFDKIILVNFSVLSKLRISNQIQALLKNWRPRPIIGLLNLLSKSLL